MTAAQTPELYRQPGPDGFPAHRYFHEGASHEELLELQRRHESLPPEQRLARVNELHSQPNTVIRAELDALRNAGLVPEEGKSDREFSGSEKDVLDKVGNDVAAAHRALLEEASQDKPRGGLIKKLEEKVVPPEGNSTGEPANVNTTVDSSGSQGGSATPNA